MEPYSAKKDDDAALPAKAPEAPNNNNNNNNGPNDDVPRGIPVAGIDDYEYPVCWSDDDCQSILPCKDGTKARCSDEGATCVCLP
ncbi:unnamed protein product [Linum trigynum]